MKTHFQYYDLFHAVSQIGNQSEKLRQLRYFVWVIFLHLFGSL